MNAAVVRATPESVPQLVASATALFAEDGGQRDPQLDLGWPRREGTAYFTELVRRNDSLCLLALSPANSAIGHLIGRIRRPDPLRPSAVAGVLESLRVDPAHHETGVATALTEEFFAWARECGANQASVTAYAANESAISFYRGRGFSPFELTLHAPL
ncbi:GNAT family N-acetyltransferase [Amycolatopsis dendrobii]|uniref:GNAT family N-acetyltransferase n=1 Tax=Amycolatopsis dendrobii TaxID=2760662 RepID=A0A7W3ZB56_9PSEU|nr:GNAT family N-acetyltransferase [Amycolatopsis dendrobii]MBB1154542.1 GNAT family N-acetyltransferase [Amycolatopsis dendrobii]